MASLSDSKIDAVTATQPDEAIVSDLVERFQNDPDLMKRETTVRIMKVWDFPGQPLFWTMLSSLLCINTSQYSMTVYTMLFKLNRLLSAPALQPVFVDKQHGTLAQRLHWIEKEGDFISHLLTALRIAQKDPPVDEIEGVLSPPIVAVATHIDEEGASDNVNEQKKLLTELLEKKGFDAHVMRPSDESDMMFFQVDNTKSGSSKRDETVLEICKRLEKMCDAFFSKPGKQLRVALKFIKLEKLIYKLVLLLGHGLIKFNLLQQLAARTCRICSEEEFQRALKSLTEFAVLFYFPDVPQLNELVVISPQWLFNSMAIFACVEMPHPALRPDWRQVKRKGIMSWKLAEYLLKSRGIQEEEYSGVLQLYRLLGIISPCQDDASDLKSPIKIGTELFVPSLIEEDSPSSNESVGVVDNPPSYLPPTLVFHPENVDHFPRFSTFGSSHFYCLSFMNLLLK